MNWPGHYKSLKNQVFKLNNFSLVPIRYKDRYDIMNWRNEQVYHLRQAKTLTKEDQDKYFSSVVIHLFDKLQPDQILFSYLLDDKCIGYGGLVHINWIDNNTELSFIMNTDLEKDFFEFHWTNYLKLVENVVFNELGLHKAYIYAFDLRPHLYKALEDNGYFKDAVLKEHCNYRGKYCDVVIHSKINSVN